MPKKLVGACLVFIVVSSGCSLKDNASNILDSGLSCTTPVTADAGTSVLSGSYSFAVSSAYEIFYRSTTRGENRLSLSLYEQPVLCDEIQKSKPVDGGLEHEVLRLSNLDVNVYYPTDASVTTGDISIVRKALDANDAGPFAQIQRLHIQLDGGAADGGDLAYSYSAESGTIHLTAVIPCNVAGSFEANFSSTDGGTEQMTGTFSAPYCKAYR